jgi:hypothetical protein
MSRFSSARIAAGSVFPGEFSIGALASAIRLIGSSEIAAATVADVARKSRREDFFMA